MKNVNTLMAIICLFAALGFLIFSLMAAPAWIQNFVFGVVLLVIAAKFAKNVKEDKNN